MALIKRGDRFHAVLYDANGKQRWFALGTDRRAAKRRHDELVVELRNGERSEPSKMTFKDYSIQWLRDYGAVRLKPSTYRSYEIYLRVHLVPFFGTTRLKDITPHQVQRYVSSKAATTAPKAMRNQMVVMKKMMSTAVDWQLLQRNPAATVTLPRVPQPEIAFLTPAQMRLLIEVTPTSRKAMIAMACLTGMRKGEIMGLKWDCVDLEERAITVKRSVYACVVQEPKSKRSIRVLPMPDALYELLSVEAETDGPTPTHFVFSGTEDPIANTLPNKVLNRALKKGKLPTVTFHGLRHSFVAAHIAAGTPLKAIQDMAGHASITTTMDRYGHLLPQAKAEAAKAIQDAVFGDG
ncbi:MAG: site-specific integrase [Coriobacteriia bacterium]|nr:site-specific integrase [Coriobacteriia bacterium]